MTPDRLTKLLLAAIAVALWMNAVNPWIRPTSASAGVDFAISQIKNDVSRIETYVKRISKGTCKNDKLC